MKGKYVGAIIIAVIIILTLLATLLWYMSYSNFIGLVFAIPIAMIMPFFILAIIPIDRQGPLPFNDRSIEFD